MTYGPKTPEGKRLANYIEEALTNSPASYRVMETTLFTSVGVYATVFANGKSWEKNAQEWFATDMEAFRKEHVDVCAKPAHNPFDRW